MRGWFRKHPLLVRFAAIILLLFISIVGYFLPSIREQLALKRFKAEHPDCYVRINARTTAAPRVTDILKRISLEEYGTSIREIEIRGHFDSSGKLFSNIDLSFLSPFSRVTKLTVGSCILSPVSIANVNHLRELKQLRFEHCEISGNGLLVLNDLKHLEHIRTNYFRLQDIELINLPSLVTLGLKNSSLGDELFDHITDVSGTLENLGLANTKVTDAGLMNLYDFSQLESVDLRFTRRSVTGYPNFTWKGIVQLNQHPSLRSIGFSNTFDKPDLEKIIAQAPKFYTRWDNPVEARFRKQRILEATP